MEEIITKPIRRAEKRDIPAIHMLLRQVLNVHHEGRPDLFRSNSTKYTDEELEKIITDETTPVFVCTDEQERVLGYAFCILQDFTDSHVMAPIRTLYIDDICVNESCRKMHVGERLYTFVKGYAKGIGCYNITLNVWQENPGARAFYERMGLKPQKTGMEEVL